MAKKEGINLDENLDIKSKVMSDTSDSGNESEDKKEDYLNPLIVDSELFNVINEIGG